MESGRGQVLVCDDTASIRYLIRINLELEGYDVLDFDNGQDLQAYLAAQGTEDGVSPLDAVVLIVDAQMARGNGWWVIEQVRALPGGDALPVLLVTASVQEHDLIQARRAGFDALLAKPFDPEELIDLVSECARAGRAGLSAL